MNVVIVYTTRTGKTKKLAEAMEERIIEEGSKVDLFTASEVEAKTLLDYDLVLLGSSTYGDGELLEEFDTLYADMDTIDMTGKRSACFGSGSTNYPQFCNAVNLLESKLIDRGAKIASDSYKISGPVMFDLDYAADWAVKMIS